MSAFDAKPVLMTAFNGAQFIEIPEDATFRPERTDLFSVECWVLTDSSGKTTLFGNLDASSVGWEMNIQASGTVALELISILTTSQLSVETDIAVNDGELHHILATYGGASTPASINIYIDGVSRTLATLVNNLTTSIVAAGTISIGANADGSSDFLTGYLRNGGFLDYELTSADATLLFNRGRLATPNFVQLSGALPFGYWPLNKGTKDFGTGDNNGTNDGFSQVDGPFLRPAASTQEIFIKPPRLTSPNSGIGMLSAVDTTSGGFDIDVGDACTWSWWAKTNAGARPFHCKVVPVNGARGWGIQISGSPLKFFWSSAQISNGLGLQFESVSGLPDFDDQMHHFALVKTAGGALFANFTLYLDGEVFAITQTMVGTAGTMQNGTNELYLGAREEDTSGNAMGTTNSTMYPTAFTQVQVREIVAKGFDADLGVFNSPLGCWAMMDPADVATYADCSANNADLTITSDGPPTWERFNEQEYHVNFSAKNNHLTTTDASLLFDRLEARTVSFWYYRDDALETLMGVSNQINPLGTPSGFRVSGGGTSGLLINMGATGGDELSLSHALPLSGNKRWHHVAIAKSAAGGAAANVDVYYDGALVAPVVVSDTWTTASQIGAGTQMRLGFTNSADRGTSFKNYVQHSTQLTAANIAMLASLGPDEDYTDVLAPLAVFSLKYPPSKNSPIDTASTLSLTNVGADVTYSARDIP